MNARCCRAHWIVFLPLLGFGCGDRNSASAGPSGILRVPAVREWRRADGDALVASPGTRMEFESESSGGLVESATAKVQRVPRIGTAVVLSNIRGKRLWRLEAYRQPGGRLQWAGMAEGGKPWIAFEPPVPLLSLPSRSGVSLDWQGTVRTGNQTLRARASSRIEDPEPVALPNGRRAEAWPIRTTVTIDESGVSPVSIQEVRWIVPGLGLVRRSRLENGEMVHLGLRNSAGGADAR